MKNPELEAAGDALVKNPGAQLDDMGPAREAIVWQKIQAAKGYLLVGTGDTHRQHRKGKLDAAGISHTFIAGDLIQQHADNDTKWAK